jgi:hypothetical protein
MGCFVDERLAGWPRCEASGAVAVVDELHVGDRVVGVGGQRGTIARAGGECFELVGVPVMRIGLPGPSAARLGVGG